MRKRTKIIIALGALCAGALVLGACSTASPYKDLAERGFNFSVCYDANGGVISSKANTRVVDTYSYEQVQKGVKLYAPDNSARGSGNIFSVERSGYFLAGWYAQKAPRTGEDGSPLDEEGNVCNVETDLLDAGGNPVYDEDGNVQKTYLSEFGKPQGYTYAEKWDFNSILQRDDFEYTEGEYAFTLYAAWVPYFTYELNGQMQEWRCTSCQKLYYGEKPQVCDNPIGDAAEGGKIPTCGSKNFSDEGLVWSAVTSYSYNPTVSEDTAVAIPAWNEETGVLEYGKFSQPLNQTFLSAYGTEDDCNSGQNAVTEFKNEGTWDQDTATATGNVARYFGKWEDGLWYRVSDKAQLAKNAGAGHSIELLADLNYTEQDEWPIALSGNDFTGTFRGNHHTISGVVVRQTSSDDRKGGLFGGITASAAFENITFENITYRLEQASRIIGSVFGLFAGELSNDARMTNVKVSGELFIADSIYIDRGYNPETGLSSIRHVYDVGLLSGNFATCGISLANITLRTENLKASVVDSSTGEIKIG